MRKAVFDTGNNETGIRRGRNSSSSRIDSATTKTPSLRSSFSWTLVGNTVYAGCQWGVLVVLARISSPETLGRFALGLAVTAPVIMFCNLQLRSVIATDAKREFRFEDYLGLRILTSTAALLVIIGITALVPYNFSTRLVILAVGIAKIIESISDVFFGLAQQHERMDRIAVSLIIKGPLSLGVLAIVMYTTHSLLLAVCGLAASWAVVLLLYDVRTKSTLAKPDGETDSPTGMITSQITLCRDKKTLYHLAALSLPLGLGMMLISLNANIPRYFIENHLGENKLGIFAAMAYFMVAGTTVVSALAQSAVPRLAKYYAQNEVRRFTSLLFKLTGFGALIGIIGIAVVVFAGKWLLGALYGPEYGANAGVFVWVAVASAVSLMQWFLSNGMTAARYFKIQAPLYFFISLVTLTLCMLLISRHGLYGAAYAILTAEVTLASATLVIDVFAVRSLKRSATQSQLI